MKNLIPKFLKRLKNKEKINTAEASLPIDLEEFVPIIDRVKPYTMTSTERIAALLDAIKYIIKNNINGDIVECGVWKGGSMMAAGEMLQRLNDCSKDIFLFDTFEGMSEPSLYDVSIDNHKAKDLLAKHERTQEDYLWCYSPIDVVKQNVYSTGYPSDKLHFIKGKVEDTLPHSEIKAISLLRLDTDWYESTKHELEHLFPLLTSGGVLIIDDYGHWQGARKAVDEYFENNNIKILLNRIDYTGRIAVKQ